MRANFSRKIINTYIYLKKPVINSKKDDMQVHNESRVTSKNLLSYHSKTTVVYYYYFYLLEWKNLNELE